MNANKLSRNKLNILKKIAEFGFITIDSFFPKKYAYSNLSRKIFDIDDKNLNKERLSHSLSQLQRYGLVQRTGSKKKSTWGITKFGQQLIKDARATKIKPKEDGVLRIIMFDIPEKYAVKRRWLRRELLYLNYKILQKSVWIGKTPVPKEFLKNINILNLQKNINIFIVSKKEVLDY